MFENEQGDEPPDLRAKAELPVKLSSEREAAAATDFEPLEIRGESLSAAILSERR